MNMLTQHQLLPLQLHRFIEDVVIKVFKFGIADVLVADPNLHGEEYDFLLKALFLLQFSSV